MPVLDLTPAPQRLIDMCGGYYHGKSTVPRVTQTVDVGQDNAMSRALDYVRNSPGVDAGERNDKGFKVAAAIKDFGVDQINARTVLDIWNDTRVVPPLDADEVDHLVRSAYQYSRNAPGCLSPEVEFDTVSDTAELDTQPEANPFLDTAVQLKPLADLPKRDWVLGSYLLGQKVTELIAPPGAGKSTFAMQMALAVSTGRADIVHMDVHHQGNVLLINNEDEMDELQRRLHALLDHFDLSQKDIHGKLHMYSGVDRPFIIAKRTNLNSVKPVDKAKLTDSIRQNNIKLLIVDPFLETHMVDENNNEQIAQVARMYRQIAVDTGCAVLIVHHTRKLPAGDSQGHIGNMDSGRGASSLSGVARVVITLYGMSSKDAKSYSVPEHLRHRYVRLDDAKANLSLASNKAIWYHKTTVTLENGDEVGVLDYEDGLVPSELSENTNMHAVLIRELRANDYQLTLNEAATALESDPVANSDNASRRTLKRRLQSWLEPGSQFVEGYELWLSSEPHRPPSNRAGRQATEWLLGRVEYRAEQPTPDVDDPFG